MYNTPDSLNPSARLRAARRRRGYISIREAASDLGLSYGTYGSHESGQRRLSQAHAETYARILGVTSQWLLQGMASSSADEEAQRLLPRPGEPERGRPNRGATRAARALEQVRRVRGFATPTSAARTYGWPVESYCRHESGRTPIPRRAARIYGHAYACPEAMFDASLEHVAISEEDLLAGRARDACEVQAFVDALDRPTTGAELAIDWLPILSGSAALLGRLGLGAANDGYFPRSFFPVPKSWTRGRHGATASELAVLEIRLDPASPGELPSLLVVHLRQVDHHDELLLRLLVTKAGCITCEAGRESEALRRLRGAGAGAEDATHDEPVRLPVLGMLLPGTVLPRMRAVPDLDLGNSEVRGEEDDRGKADRPCQAH